MGRGDKDGQRASGANPLFGPRRSRTLTSAHQRERARRIRQRQRERRQSQYRDELRAAGHALVAGDELPLLTLLSRETPDGLIGTEREALRSLIARLHQELGEPWQLETAVALQLLRRRAHERRVLASEASMLQQLFLRQIAGMVTDECATRFAAAAGRIGRLPRVWTSGLDKKGHLRARDSEDLLCRRIFVPARRGGPGSEPDTGLNTPLTDAVSCAVCCQAWRKGAEAEWFESERWLTSLVWQRQEHEQAQFLRSLEHFDWDGPDPERSALDIYTELLNERLNEAGRALADLGLVLPDQIHYRS